VLSYAPIGLGSLCILIDIVAKTTRSSPVATDWHNHTSKIAFHQIFLGESTPMSALVPSSPPHASSVSFDGSTLAQDDGQLQASVPPQLQSREWLGGASVPLMAKRAVDLAGALAGLTLLTPVILVIALLIRLEGRGPILFRQLRRGYRGKLFRVIKFRTMNVDAEQHLDALEESNESAGGVLFKLRRDPRVTRLGQFLRYYSLDELPQLINILCGEMSLVGPRPLQLRDSDRLSVLDPKGYARRLEVMPGLTGPWQVGGRSEVDYQRMVELDVEYVENWSIGRDLRIIAKTFFVVLLRRGAY
jgi:lipopolysaccharide/colanic/teichoic acid biosynthesis glycosyltransferase